MATRRMTNTNGVTTLKEDKYSVKPILRGNLLSGVRNPIYEGFDLSHARRIGNFDVSGSLNLFTDEIRSKDITNVSAWEVT